MTRDIEQEARYKALALEAFVGRHAGRGDARGVQERSADVWRQVSG
jgi:hypothetical protein